MAQLSYRELEDPLSSEELEVCDPLTVNTIEYVRLRIRADSPPTYCA